MKRWQPDPDRAACVRHYGNMRQLCGLKRYVFADGRAQGAEAIDVDTGGGLAFTVLPGRGMDISALSWRGVPVAYLTKAGVGASALYDPIGDGWLKNFFAGMLTTCGMSNAGPACRGDLGILKDVPLGLHGGVSNTPADNVCAREEWRDGRYALTVSGRMEEGRLHGEHLELRRTIETELGACSLKVTDEYTNVGEMDQMLMFFYHINIGHPLLGPAARFCAPVRGVRAETPHARADLAEYDRCGPPRPGYLEQQFFLDMGADENGDTLCALVNDALELAVYLKYNVRELPCIAEWKVLRDAEYVLAFEPGNCHAVGREEQLRRGAQEILAPMQSRRACYEIGIADGPQALEALEEEIRKRRETPWANPSSYSEASSWT